MPEVLRTRSAPVTRSSASCAAVAWWQYISRGSAETVKAALDTRFHVAGARGLSKQESFRCRIGLPLPL